MATVPRSALGVALWQITTIAPNGRMVTTHNHTTTQAVREMLRRRKRGHKLPSPCAMPEPNTIDAQQGKQPEMAEGRAV